MTKPNISINKIKKDLANNNIISCVTFLNSDLPNILEIFKEQRFLLIPSNYEELFQLYEEKVKVIYKDQKKINHELNYTKFLRVYIQNTKEINREINQLLKDFLSFGLKSFFFAINTQLESYFESIHDDLIKLLNKNSLISQSASEISSNTAFFYHVLKGKINDALFGQTNLVNIFAKLKEEETYIEVTENLDDELVNKLIDALNLSSKLNTYQYAIDQVSCNEWYIETVNETEKGKLIFEFAIYDPLFQKAREIGLQRMLSEVSMRKEKRWLKLIIQHVQTQIFDYAWNYFQEKNNILLTSDEIFISARESMIKNLDLLDAEDELLVGTSENHNIDILSHYIVAAVLTAFTFAANGLKKQLPKKKYQFTYPVLPIIEIKKIISELRLGDKIINSEIIENYISTLPLKRHLDIFKQPYIRDYEDKIFATDFIYDGWVASIRTTLTQGGRTADLVGKMWENYIADILKKDGWSNVIEGLKIKENGKILTDIDIVAKKEHVLLLIQLKVYYGTGINSYEQWKFKKKLQHAAHQVKISETFIKKDINILRNHFKKYELQEITYIKPVVMTNCHYYNGWICDNIPIMSVGSLMQIVNGTNVKFMTKNGNVLSEKKYSNDTKLNINEFLSFIDLPLDWRIGPQKYKIRTHMEDFDNLIFKFPIFEIENDLQ
ncbi:hypothetical protein ABXT08_08260 [Chryseobacterium sp. NRRL B-14859]|uniref:hypothetical protein n=1 Tax=Chryseobacterium sp. NRRL B-14859 TaxID=1562763 RepID=UPI0033953CC4